VRRQDRWRRGEEEEDEEENENENHKVEASQITIRYSGCTVILCTIEDIFRPG
jgi:hypothetical protein